MKVIYKAPMYAKVREAISEALRDGKEVDCIQLTPEEYHQFATEGILWKEGEWNPSEQPSTYAWGVTILKGYQ